MNDLDLIYTDSPKTDEQIRKAARQRVLEQVSDEADREIILSALGLVEA